MTCLLTGGCAICRSRLLRRWQRCRRVLGLQRPRQASSCRFRASVSTSKRTWLWIFDAFAAGSRTPAQLQWPRCHLWQLMPQHVLTAVSIACTVKHLNV